MKKRKMYESYGDAVFYLRKLKRWSQERLARELNVSLATVQRWEGGYFKPSQLARKFLDKLLAKEGVEVEER